MAKGIPFIYAYDDIDIPDNVDFCLKFPNDDSDIDFDKVLEFAKSTSKHSDISMEMRDYAQRVMDWKIKVLRMYEFAKSL